MSLVYQVWPSTSWSLGSRFQVRQGQCRANCHLLVLHLCWWIPLLMNFPMSEPISSSGSYCINEKTFSTCLLVLVVLYLFPRAELLTSPGHTGRLMTRLRTPGCQGCYRVYHHRPPARESGHPIRWLVQKLVQGIECGFNKHLNYLALALGLHGGQTLWVGEGLSEAGGRATCVILGMGDKGHICLWQLGR